MPLMFFGNYGSEEKPRLWSKGMQPMTPGPFKGFLPESTGRIWPKSGIPNFARITQFVTQNTTALSWADAQGRIQTIFLVGILGRYQAIPQARIEFPEVMPGSLLFRTQSRIRKR